MTKSLNDSMRSASLQLGILLHQLLQAEAWKLYRNLGFFAFSFALIDRSLAVFRMSHLLSREEPALSRRLFDRLCLGNAELLASAGEKFRDVFDRVVGLRGHGLLRSACVPPVRLSGMPRGALILILIRVMRGVGIARVGTAALGRPAERSSATAACA